MANNSTRAMLAGMGQKGQSKTSEATTPLKDPLDYSAHIPKSTYSTPTPALTPMADLIANILNEPKSKKYSPADK